MKQRLFSFFLCVIFLFPLVFSAHTAGAASSYSSAYIYTDADTGITFVVPEGWSEQKLDAETSQPFQVQFSSQKDPGSTFLYGNADLWSEMTASERSGYTRSDIDSAYVYAYDDGALIDYLAERMIQGAADAGGEIRIDEIELVTYGRNESIEISVSQEIFGVRVPMTAILHVENGYIHVFIFAGTSDQAIKDFQSVLYSLRVPAAEEVDLQDGNSERADESDWTDRLISLFLAFIAELFFGLFIYTFPLLAFQTLFRKKPMRKKSALILLCIYSVIAYFVVSFATLLLFDRIGNLLILLFWAWVTYHGLAGGNGSDDTPAKANTVAAAHDPTNAEMPYTADPAYAKNAPAFPEYPMGTGASTAAQPVADTPISAAPPTPQPAAHVPASAAQQMSPEAYVPASLTPQTPPAPRIQFCRNCGFRLLEDSKFCSSCGTPVVPITKE